MASSAHLDAKNLEKWEDAFQYPIPQVRQLERQLQMELSSNRMKLRDLVGESYRDLLRTAERIIEMDLSAQKTERNLSETSRNCNSRLLEKKAKNLKIFEERVGAGDREKFTFASQLAVLQSCPSVVSRMLSNDKGEFCLLATKVFVVSRLLLKSLLQKDSMPLLESLKTQLSALRAFLLQHIDLLLSTPHLPVDQLLSALASFSLLKTSSSADVLRHFMFARSTAISSVLLEAATPSSAAILGALFLFNQTLQNAQVVFPKRLSESLLSLKSRSLFQDPDLISLAELGLDSNGRWLPEQVREFIPWVRHDDLERARVNEQAKVWAAKELETLNMYLEKSVQEIKDVRELVALRGSLLGRWKAGKKARQELLQDGGAFRELITARLIGIFKATIGGLAVVGGELGELLQGIDGQSKDDSVSLWSDALSSMGLSNGGLVFKEAVQSRVHGRSSSIKAFGQRYDQFLSDIAESAAVVRGLKNLTPSSEDDEDDFEAEEERAQEDLEDAELVEKEVAGSLEAAYREFEEIIGKLIDILEGRGEGEGGEGEVIMARAAFLLRVIRQTRQRPPKRGEDVLAALNWFGTALVPKLHTLVAVGVGKKSSASVSELLYNRKWSGRLTSKALWEGAPPLPVQPSPLVFKFLHDLVTDMHQVGDDIWTPMAVKCIKSRASKELWKVLENVLEDKEIVESMDNVATNASETQEDDDDGERTEKAEGEAESNGEGTDKGDDNFLDGASGKSAGRVNDQESPRNVIGRDWAIQLLFDALYLDEALLMKRANGGNSGITSLAGKVESAVGAKLGFDEELRRRLEGSAREYWKRTCLLFALLS